VALLASRANALAQKLDRVDTSPIPSNSSGPSVGVYAICETCGVQGNAFPECYNSPPTIEHVNT